MAEIEVFATCEESGELVQWLLDRNWQFIPDLHYEAGRFDRLHELQAIQSLAESAPKFFVVREDLIESPLSVKETATADRHFFYVVQRHGGPTLDFWWGQRFDEDGRPRLCATELSYYPWYLNSVTGIREKPSKALRDTYVQFAKAVRASRRRIKPGVREFWISPAVEDLVRSGWVLNGLEHFTPDQILSSSR